MLQHPLHRLATSLELWALQKLLTRRGYVLGRGEATHTFPAIVQESVDRNLRSRVCRATLSASQQYSLSASAAWSQWQPLYASVTRPWVVPPARCRALVARKQAQVVPCASCCRERLAAQTSEHLLSRCCKEGYHYRRKNLLLQTQSLHFGVQSWPRCC